MNLKTPFSILSLQIINGLIFLYVGIDKFVDSAASVQIFTALQMEPQGRYIIGATEILVGILMLTRMPALGAFIGIGVMLGALIAHTTILGLMLEETGGLVVAMLIYLLISSSAILWVKRRELPVFGASF